MRKAAALNEAGIEAPGRTQPNKREPMEVPGYFSAALKKNKKASKTFGNFPLSKRGEYRERSPRRNAKKPAMKDWPHRFEWLAEGKPWQWKYMPAKK